MKRTKKTFLLMILLTILGIESVAQTTSPSPSTSRLPSKNNGLSAAEAAENNRRRERELLPGQEQALRQLGNTPIESDTFMSDRENQRVLENNVVPVPPRYTDKYKALQKEKKVRLAKILNTKCNDGLVVSVNNIEDCQNSLQIWGGGSYYSFRNKTNYNSESEIWADIRLYEGEFLVGANTVQGIIGRIGDSNIEDITLDSPGLKFIKEFIPEKKLSDFESQRSKLKSGVNEGGFTYSNAVKVGLNSTYVLRSIAYRTNGDIRVDNRVDMIIVFKVISIESDGSLIIVWRELSKEKSPRFDE